MPLRKGNTTSNRLSGKIDIIGMRRECSLFSRPIPSQKQLFLPTQLFPCPMQSIFDEFSRIEWDIKRYPESNYDFLNKSAWPLADLARTTINRLVRSIGDMLN